MEIIDPSDLDVCRVCLTTDNKLYSMLNFNLKESYEKLTGIPVTEDAYPHKLCTECARRLLNCDRFRGKCIRGHTLLTEIWDTYGGLTKESIKTVDRVNNDLISNLQLKNYEPDHYDFSCEHTDRQAKTSKVVENVTVKNEVAEVEIFINEDDDFNQDDDYVKNEDDNDSESEDDDEDKEIISKVVEKLRKKVASTDKVVTRTAAKRKLTQDSDVKLKSSKVVKRQTKVSKKSEVKSVKARKQQSKPVKDKRRRKHFLYDGVKDAVFTITNVTVEEQIEEIQKRQQSSNYLNAKFKCTVCFKGFIDDSAYNNHMIRHTKTCGEYQCEICRTYYKDSNALKKHMTAQHTRKFSCNKCRYVTMHTETARKHEIFHKGTKYKCADCSMEFEKFTTYMSHKRVKHPSDFVCELCGYSFVSQKGVDKHKLMKHMLENDEITPDSPLCELCNIRFISIEALQLHMAVSTKHKTSDSDLRERNAKRPTRKTGRRNRRKGEKRPDDVEKTKVPVGPTPCEQCGVVLDTPRAYHHHFKRSHPGMTRTIFPSMKTPFMCEVCGRIFQTAAHLKDHKWAHTGEKRFKCDKCEKSFTHNQNLMFHIKIHSETRPMYDCPTCGKQFTLPANRNRHMLIHTGVKAYKCSTCNKCFTTGSERYAHIKHVHLKEPWPRRARGRHDMPHVMED